MACVKDGKHLSCAAPQNWLMCQQALPDTEVKVYDLHAPVKVPWNDFASAKQILDAHENDNTSRLVFFSVGFVCLFNLYSDQS